MTGFQIIAFWDWFSASHEQIEALIAREDEQAVHDLIEPQVAALHAGLGWEVGPEGASDLFFAFSLNGLQENVGIAQSIISAAPPLKGWKMRVGRPPKEWKGRFFMSNELGQRIELETSSWVYVLTGYDNNSFFDVKLLAESLPRMDERARKQAALLVVEMYLGEQVALELIGDADLIAPVPDDIGDHATPIQHLRDHLKHLADEQSCPNNR